MIGNPWYYPLFEAKQLNQFILADALEFSRLATCYAKQPLAAEWNEFAARRYGRLAASYGMLYLARGGKGEAQ